MQSSIQQTPYRWYIWSSWSGWSSELKKKLHKISNELRSIAFFLRSLWSRTIAIRNVSKTIVRMRQIKMNMSSFVSFVSTKSSQGSWQSEVFNILSLVMVDQRVSVADRPRIGDFSSSILTKQSLAVPHSSDISPLAHMWPKKSRCTWGLTESMYFTRTRLGRGNIYSICALHAWAKLTYSMSERSFFAFISGMPWW